MKQLSFLLAGVFALLCYTASSQTLPAGFSVTTIGSGWNLPLGTAFTSDGQKMFVWEKDGRVWVCNRNASGAYIKQTTPVLDISEEVANWGDHGLMGFALDPNYLNNGLIYLLYVVDRHYLMNFGTPAYNPSTSSTGATIGRITRYKTTTSGSNVVTDLSSRFILLGETRQTGICIMHDSHGLGTLAFAADGTLLATAGDGGSYYLVDKGSDTDTDFDQALNDGIIRPAENVGAFRAQLLNSHNGKLLRIDPVTGNGVSSNPYYSEAQPRSPKSRVWAFGLRNPFRFSIKPGTGSTNPAAGDVGEIYVGDVGWNTYEEVSIISRPGVNCGWPLFEGLTAQPGYTSALTANLDEPNPLFGVGGCTKQYFNFQDLIKQVTADNDKTIYNPCNPATPIGTGERYVHFRPSIDWKHFTNEARVGTFSGNTASTAIIGTSGSNVIGTPFPGNCSVGGPWYNGSNFPAAYQNKYFAADHDGKWIRCFSTDFTDVVTEVKSFGTNFLGTVHVNMNPLDGTLVVVELGNFSTIGPAIKEIRFGGNQAPVLKMTSDKKFGPSVLNVNFTGNTSFDPDGTIASYSWNFGDGATSTSANPSHNFTAPANTPTKYVVKLTVTDNGGASSMDSIIISVNNTPPVVNITSPVKNSLYTVGPDTLYTCAATVTDTEHSAAALKYEWQTFLRHNSHVHPEGISNAVSPTTNISRIGCNGDDYYWYIQLTVTDGAGLSAVDSAKIFPDCNPGADNIPPTVSSVNPLNAATNVTTGTTISAIFSETIDPVTVTAATFQVKDAANNIVPGSITTSFNQVTFTPSAALGGSTVYTATIKSGTSGVKDVAGNSLASDYSWSFTTVDLDTTPPVVISVLPANGATAVQLASSISANFNEAVNTSTVNGTTFQLRDAANNLIAATINTAADKITLVPSAPLAPLTTYTATITGGVSGITDLAGNELASDYVWSFTTAEVDNTPPTVTSVLPANAAIGVGLSATITANFSEAIDASSVNGTSFILTDAGNNVIPATVTTSANILTLTPSSALATSTTYTVTIVGGPSGIKDLAVNALANNYSWSFTTVGGTSASPVTVQSFYTKNGIGTTTHSLTAVPAGALLVLSTTADAFPSDCIVTSTPALAWTKRVDAGATSSDNAEIWTAVYPAGGAISITSDWGAEFSQTSVCYVVLNAESNLAGVFGSAVLQAAPSVTITTSRNNSIIFGCTADWKAINGATRTLRDNATERYYFKDGHFTTYHYTKAAASQGAYTEGVSFPSTQQASTSVLEIRGEISVTAVPPTITTHPVSQSVCAGANVSFSSNATGGTPTVKWQSSSDGTTWSDIDGAVEAVFTFTATTADNNKQYRAIWTNSDGPASSNPATLTINTISAPQINVVDNCGSSELTAVTFGGTLLWSNGATTPSITVLNAGTYTVTQTANGCTSAPANAIAAPKMIPFEPAVSVVDDCGSSTLTASAFTGSLLWSTGETTESITVTTAGTYTVTQTVNGCTGTFGSATAAPKTPVTEVPTVTVVNTCGNSVLSASEYSGSLLWSTGATTPSITVTSGGTYTVEQILNGCSSPSAQAIASPLTAAPTPLVAVVNNCESSILTASGFTGSLLWSTGETTESITVTTAGTYTVKQTVDGCISELASATAAPKTYPAAPLISVADNCGSSLLTASGYSGSLLWSTGETTESVIVTTPGTYSVTQTVDGCASPSNSGVAAPKDIPADAPQVSVVNNCGNSILTASGYTGSLIWSTGETTPSINVTNAATYTVAQIINGCAGPQANVSAAPIAIPSTPAVTVVNNCGQSILTASGYTGSLMWNTGETTESINVTNAGTYTVTQTIDGCTSEAGSDIAEPKAVPPAPGVTVIDHCGKSELSASGYTGSLLWSTGETTPSIIVISAGNYSVTQEINGCVSSAANGVASPLVSTVEPPTVSVINNCGNSVLTASGYTGALLWSTGETTESITVTTGGTFSVTQTIDGCISPLASGIAAPVEVPSAPIVIVANACGQSELHATAYTGSLQWYNDGGSQAETITVTEAGTYMVTQTVNGCTSDFSFGIATPKVVPSQPSVSVVDNCGITVLTASGYTGTLLWNTAETTESITVTTGGTYTVAQTLDGCTSTAGSGTASPLSVPSAPVVEVINNCGNSILTASGYSGSLLWSTGETTESITVTVAGTYTVTQTISGCTSPAANGIAAPKLIPGAPIVGVIDNCGSSSLMAFEYTGTLLWSTGETTASIISTSGGTYTVTQTMNGCTSSAGIGIAAPKPIPSAPVVSVSDNCGSSLLAATGTTGTLLWSNGSTTSSISVISAGTYTVTQTVDGCTSPAGSGLASPLAMPVLSSALTGSALSGIAFSYTPTSATAGISFTWSRPAVTGISNSSANGTGAINETLINTLTTAVNVTYVYTLTANGCTNTQNVVVAVSSVPIVTTVLPANGSTGVSTNPTITANFSESINPSTVTAATFQLKDASNNVVSATISTSNNLITLLPTAALVNSSTYTVTIKGGTSGVQGLAGNALASDYSWTFTTAPAELPLTIHSVNTKTGTSATTHALTGVPAGSLLVLTTTADAFLSNCIVTSSPALTWTKRVDAGAISSDNAEIWTASFPAGGTINIISNWGVNNSQASVCYVVLNADPTLNGVFGTAVSQSAPSVTVTTTRPNSIIFGCTADWKNINGATRILRDAATERLYFRDNHYATYHYTKATTAIGAYTEGVSLPTGQQASTALLEIRSATVIVDNTPPTVTSVSPVDGATAVVVSTNASAMFSEAMNASAINSTNIELRNSSNVLIPATVSYNAATNTATLTPSSPLANSTVYTATIKGGGTGVKDAAGNALVNDYTWSFTTEVGDITPPIVTSVNPLNGATGVNVVTNIVANFSEAVNASTVTSATFQLRDVASNLISASVSSSSGQIMLDPIATLAPSTVYTVTITGGASGVKDLAGNALAADYSWSFTTSSVVSQPVTIQSVSTKTGVEVTVHSLTGVPAGALLVLATTADAVVSDCIVSSSPALTWTKRVDAGAVSSDNAEIWTAVYPAGGSISVTSNWGEDNSQSSVCYVVLNAEPTLGGTFGTAELQAAPSVTVTTTRENSIIFGCTADWKRIDGATRTLRDAATERLYFRDGNYTTYHYTKATTSIGSYTEGVSAPTGQQASTALLEIRGVAPIATRPVNSPVTSVSGPNSNVYTNSLGQNFPNPFDQVTNIPFTIARAENVNLALFDMHGRLVRVLINGSKDAGQHIVHLDAASLAKGIYFYKLRAGDFTEVRKLIIW